MKSGSTSHRPNPPAVDRSPAKKLKRVNVKQNSAANVGTDAREGLMGPEANASERYQNIQILVAKLFTQFIIHTGPSQGLTLLAGWNADKQICLMPKL